MNHAPFHKLGKKGLEDDKLWQEANALAEYFYSLLPDFPEEEKWNTGIKLRNEANNLIYYTAQAIGHAAPEGKEYDWSYTRKSIAALKTMYRFGARQKFYQLDPEIMVRLGNLFELIDNNLEETYARTKADQEEDLEYLRKKYELSKESHQ